MPYPNDLKLNVIIAQTSGSADGTGKFPFTERIISGSGLILQTDAQGNLIGSTGINIAGDITASNISASGWITASNILDTGNLTVLGNTNLGDTTTDNIRITGSTSISGSLTIEGDLNATASSALTASKVLISDLNNTSGTYYVTFAQNTGSAQSISTDSNVLTYNPSTNVLNVGAAASGSVVVGTNLTMQDIGGSSQLRVGITSTDTASFLVSGNAFQVVKGTSTDRVSTNLPLSASANVLFSNTSQATSWDTGSLVVNGGVGIGKNLYVSGSLNALGNSVIGNETSDTVQITASLSLSGSTSTNSSSFTDLTANGVVYTNGNKILSTNSNLTFDGTTLTSTGNTTLGNVTSDIIKMTGSVSISGSLSIEGTLSATSSWAINALTSSRVIVTDTNTGTGPYYVTFVDGTSGAKEVRTDSSTLTWNATTNTLSSSGNFIANTVTASLSGSAIQTGNATINGGAINNTTIGLTTPSTGNFTNLSASNLLVTSSLSFIELMPTGSSLLSTGIGVNISASATTGSNTVVQLTSLVSTGSSFALVINSTSGISGSAFAISASNGQIVGTLFTGSNALFTSVTASVSGSTIQTGNATINGGAINNTTIGLTTPSTGNFTNLTASNISSSGFISASNQYIAGNLTTLGNTFLGDATSDSIRITGSTSISGSLSVTGNLLATSSWAINALTSSRVIVTDTTTGTGPYYVTFVDGTTDDRAIRTDSSVLTWNATTNTLSSSGNIVATSFTSSNGVQFTNNNATVSPVTTNTGVGYNLIVSAGDTGTGGGSQGGNLYLDGGNAGDLAGNIYLNAGTASGALTTGSVYINAGGLIVGENAPVNINNATQATNYDAAALEVVGGVGIGKNLYVSGSTWIYGDLTLFGSSSVVYISSSTVIINDNIIQLNAYLPFERYSGFEVFDSGSNQRSASLLWDGKNDNWITIDQNNSASNIVLGPTSSFSSDNITGFTANVIPKAYDQTGITDSKLTDNGTALQYTGNLISASSYYGTTGSLTYITGALVTYVTGSFTTITIATGSNPGVGAVPVHPTASGMAGQINVDNNFIYVYTNNIWKRVPISNWTP